MHSMSGAYEEALLKHVNPSGLLGKSGLLRVIDLGFGMGYNSLALINELYKINKNIKLEIVAFERNNEYANLLENITFNDERDKIFSLFISAFKGKIGVECDFWKLNILFGDARKNIQNLDNNIFDAVFHDPFSPAKNPELWSLDFFKEERRVIKEDGIITTYSAAPQIRRAIYEAGFQIGRGPSVGPKKEGTLASVYGLVDKFSQQEIIDLINEIKSEPYLDSLLGCNSEEILTDRLERMRIKRERKLD